ncbi:hypothetical protein M422DRAFT_254636 [Sphaerobolus stellatus SS14]|uniref:Glucose receptor Git3 N-terminal domain-containing protein n=1 Tax=Sphaerobolus stellatus (strain SS14) TaxID=990650 RepID=A0A0C9V5M9_SPHS4|nr:hypothetical protein M422DRAFT_254636 [Sphaerobolus stellatus SS14]
MTFLGRGETIGLVLTAEAGLASVFAVLFLLGKVIRNAAAKLRENRGLQWWQVISSPFEIYMISLLFGDLLQGLGIIIDLRWLHRGSITCTLLLLSETAVAMSTLAIAIHSFFVILFRRGGGDLKIPLCVVSFIWLYVILFASIANGVLSTKSTAFITPTLLCMDFNHSNALFSITDLSAKGCWVGSRYTAQRIAGAYFWLWFTAAISIIIYPVMFLCLRGSITNEEKRWWRVHFRFSHQPHGVGLFTRRGDKSAAKDAFLTLLYPLAYIGIILGLSIVRWSDFFIRSRQPDKNTGQQVIPLPAIFLAQVIFALSGVINVTLLIHTRPGLVLTQPGGRGHVFDWATATDLTEQNNDQLDTEPYMDLRGRG